MRAKRTVFLFFMLGCQAALPPERPRVTEPALGGPATPSGDAAHPDSKGTKMATAPGQSTAGVASHCEDGWQVALGPYLYMNNMFAKDKAKGPYQQCLLSRDENGKRELGWTWSWPGSDPLGFGYPEIVFGWKPWFAESTDPRLPIRVGDIKTLVARYQVETDAAGKWSLTPGVWLTRGVPPNRVSAGAIASEIVVWADYDREARPIGSRVGAAPVDGVEYDLLHQPNQGDRGDGSGWDLYYFKTPKPMREGTINFHAFLAYLLKAGRIEADDLVASVEFGSELQSGSGVTWVRSFDVVVERR